MDRPVPIFPEFGTGSLREPALIGPGTTCADGFAGCTMVTTVDMGWVGCVTSRIVDSFDDFGDHM